MRVQPEEFETLRQWTAVVLALSGAMPAGLAPEDHPIALLDADAARAPARARAGLAMMIGDLVEMTIDLAGQDLAALDARLDEDGLPTLSAIRLRFAKAIRSIAKRGFIRSEAEYFAVRNAVEGVEDDAEALPLWRLLGAYEEAAKA